MRKPWPERMEPEPWPEPAPEVPPAPGPPGIGPNFRPYPGYNDTSPEPARGGTGSLLEWYDAGERRDLVAWQEERGIGGTQPFAGRTDTPKIQPVRGGQNSGA